MVFFKLGAIFVELKEGTDMDIFVTTHAVFHSLQKLKSLSCLSGFIGRKANKSKASIFSSFLSFLLSVNNHEIFLMFPQCLLTTFLNLI